MKKSALQRTIELAKTATKIGLQEVRSGDLKSRLEQARILTESLSQLKGAAMKAGQLLSLEVGDYFPKEAREIFAVLQNAADPVDYDEILKTLKQELGEKDFALLHDLSVKPVASASIGQVHSAFYQSQKLALKVQYRGVADSIDSDLRILRKIAGALCKLTGREMNLDPLFQELQEVLKQEVDYLREADFQKLYGARVKEISGVESQAIKTLAGRTFRYFVPEVLTAFTTERVLAMEWQEGLSLRDWLNSSPSLTAREHLANSVLNLYCHEFYAWGLVQTDPNFANFLIRTKDQRFSDIDADHPALVLLDFGATREYDRQFIENYVKLLKTTVSGDKKAIVDTGIEFGLLDPRENESARESFYNLMEVATRPFAEPGKPFRFADEEYAKLSRQVVRELTQSVKFSPPPYTLIFLHRKLGGLFSLLQKLDVTLDVSPYWQA